MATSKTLTPTNVTIQIPAFTDAPDQRVNSNCIDKEADAINALNSKIARSYTSIKDSNQYFVAHKQKFGRVCIVSVRQNVANAPAGTYTIALGETFTDVFASVVGLLELGTPVGYIMLDQSNGNLSIITNTVTNYAAGQISAVL